MNISNIALLAFIIASTTTTALLLTTPRQVSSFLMTQHQLPPRIIPSSTNNIVLRSSSTTARHHADEQPRIVRQVMDLESLTVPQLKEIYNEYEKINEACTEDCTQTNDECDVVLKDERDELMVQIQNIVQARNQNKTLLKKNYVVELEYQTISEIVKTPWLYSLDQIKKTITSMESLNCQCTEEGNQTNAACDIELKEERDAAIETLTLYLKSVRNLIVADATATATAPSIAHHNEDEDEKTTRKRKIVVPEKEQQQDRTTTSFSSSSSFDMDEIRDCIITNPGRKSLEVMQSMLFQLETQHNACTEDCTQTNAECEIEVKAERDTLIEAVVTQIHDATLCLNQINAFAKNEGTTQMAIDDIMKTVLNTSTTLLKEKVVVATTGTHENHPITTTTTTTTFTAPTDEFVIQI